jgi:hypothetical protein
MPRTRRPRYADVAATLALVLALGGTSAYAAQQINQPPKHSVGKSQLKKDAVTSSRIKNGSVKGKDLRKGTIGATPLADGAVTGPKLGNGSVDTTKLANAAVGTAKLATDSVTAAKIANGAVTFAQLAGAEVTYSVAVPALDPDECATLDVPLAGANPNQLALMSVAGAPAGIERLVIGQPWVTPGQVHARACNLAGGTFNAGSLNLQVATLG